MLQYTSHLHYMYDNDKLIYDVTFEKRYYKDTSLKNNVNKYGFMLYYSLHNVR